MKESFTLQDLETTDVVQLRNGSLGIIFKELDIIVYQFYGMEYISDEFENDFTSKHSHSYDIVKVYRNSNGFYELENTEPIYVRNDIDVVYEEKKNFYSAPLNVVRDDLIVILTQAFYGNRVTTKIAAENIDRFILGHQTSYLPFSEPVDRTIIKVPNAEPLVIIYNNYKEEEALKRNKRWYQEDGYVAKPLAVIPELDLEIFSRPIACRMNSDGKLESLQNEDYEVLFKYFLR